jgi:hypothetical protein
VTEGVSKRPFSSFIPVRKGFMSNGTKKTIRLQPAHKALEDLLAALDTVNLKTLPKRDGAAQETADAWVDALRAARTGLVEWCGTPGRGANGFTLEVQSKR